jgi:2-amino-4-hydroxy-6-hydroxymethyldihydropteridine diphosphokinase
MLKWRLRAVDKTPEHIYLGFGSNLCDREENFRRSVQLLQEAGYSVLRISELYETEPWGGAGGDDYLNAVLELEMRGAPEEMLSTIHTIESELGRVRESKYSPRPCDLDILFWGSAHVNQPDMMIPHPYISERRFVLRPLCDLIPDLVHPVIGKSFRALLAVVRDDLDVRPKLQKTEPAPV